MIGLAKRFPVACASNGAHQKLLAFLLEGEGIHLLGADSDFSNSHVVTSPYLLFNTYSGQGHVVGVGMPDRPLAIPYPVWIASAFWEWAALPPVDADFFTGIIRNWAVRVTERVSVQRGENIFPHIEKGVFLCPFLGSGRFRDVLKLKQNKLIKRATIIAEKNNAKIILVGGSNDPHLDIKGDNYIDMRGQDLQSMMRLAGHPKIISGIGFDGFWMHCFDLLSKSYLVKFRGRFTKNAYNMHINSVNISFLTNGARKYM
jgi:hypothetical protein